jgi:phosphatidylglycerol:prolipoprotein diacylglycerol transferase
LLQTSWIQIGWYPLLIALGFIIGKIYVTSVLKSQKKLTEYDSIILLNYLILGMLIGGRFVHCFLYHPGFYLQYPVEILKFWKGGMASHGGYIGIILAIWLYAKKYPSIRPLWLYDLLIAPAILTGAFIRIGNLFNSEILGTPSNLPWAMTFLRVDNIPRHPIQLYEAISYFLVAACGFILFHKKTNKIPDGKIFGVLLLIGMSVRLGSDYFKADPLFNGALALPFILCALMLRFKKKITNE